MSKDNYHSIDINNGIRHVKAKDGDTLLSSLASHDIFLPSACGGKASCGLCKVKITDGGGADEKAFKIRLACQTKVNGDMRISIPEEVFGIKKYRTRVVKITKLTHDIKEIKLELPEPEKISYISGQFVQVQAEPYGNIKEKAKRAYSIASVPSDKKSIELIIRLVPGGICSTYLHDYLKIGDELIFNGPHGEFRMHDDTAKYVFIAGGSGLAPIKSMILDLLEKGIKKEMTLFFGAVSKKDLYYYEFFKKLEAYHGSFRYVPALSAPIADDGWKGETGLITDVVIKNIQNREDRQAYLCGSPGMLNACIKALENIGFAKEDIFFDKF